MSERRAWRDPNVAGLILALLVAFAGGVHYVNLTFDDVFISFRYAENLAQGHGLVFNPGERVEGYSNFLWTLLLVIPALLGASAEEFGMLWAAKVAGILLSLGTVGLLWQTLRLRLGPEKTWGPILISLYLASLAPLHAWSAVGLETSLVTFLLMGAFSAFYRESLTPASPGIASAVWLVLAALTRPEPVALAGVFVAARALQTKKDSSFDWKPGLKYLAVFAVPYAAFLAFRWSYYGELVPNTYYAKLHDDPRAVHRGLTYVTAAADDLGLGACAVIGALAMALRRRVTIWGGLVTSTLTVQVLIAVYEGGDWMPGYRMLVPALPALCLLLAEVWAVLDQCPLPAKLNTHKSSSQFQQGGRLLLSGGLAFSLTLSALGSSDAVRVRGFPSGFDQIKLDAFVHYESARWMKKNLRPGLVAIGEAGVVPYVTGFAALDMFGLTDAHIARQPGRMHAKFDKEYVLGKRPRYVYLLMTSSQKPRPSHPHGRILLADERFEQRYKLRKTLGRVVIYERRSKD